MTDKKSKCTSAHQMESSSDEEHDASYQAEREYLDAAASRSLRSFNSTTNFLSNSHAFTKGKRGEEKAVVTVRMLSLNIFIRHFKPSCHSMNHLNST